MTAKAGAAEKRTNSKAKRRVPRAKTGPRAARAPKAGALDKPSPKTRAPLARDLDPRLAVIARAFAGEPRVSLGKLFASLGLRVDGKIFAMVVRGELVLKLPKARVEQLVTAKAGRHFEPGPGRVMKEWVTMMSAKPDALTLGREAFAFVSASRR